MKVRDPALLLRWRQMTEREQLVWSATFAQQPTPSLEAAALADQAIEQLRELKLDEPPIMEPEYEAARAGIYLDIKDFVPWYRVSLRLTHGHSPSYRKPTDEECAEAYERYQMGRSDFY